jgi:hypothetical protein
MQVIKQKFKKATSTSKGKIIISAILLILVLTVAGGLLYWQTHKKKIIRDKLESAIHAKSGGLYAISYETMDLDEISGNLSVVNLTLAYDSLKYASLLQQEKAPSILLKIHIPQISVTGVKTPRALIDKKIDGKKLEIRNPSIEIIYTRQGKDSARNVPTKEIYEQILGDLNELSIDTVAIINAHIITRNLKTKRPLIELTGTSIQLVDIQVDSAANADTSRLFFAKQATVTCENLSWYSANRLYKYEVQNMLLNSTTREAYIKSFAIDPQLGEEAFVKSLPTQDDRFDFSLQRIAVKNLDFHQLVKEAVTADSILIGSASFKIYRDLNIPRDKKNRVGTYPHQAIVKIAVPVSVKKIWLGSTFAEYKEKSSITGQTGKVRFTDARALISNFTNRKDLIAQNNRMTVDINCRFLDKTPFRVSWLFYLQNPNGRFDVKGHLGSLDGKALNPLTEPMGPARIEEGDIKSLNFDFSGTDYTMNGTVQLLYDDLKIALLEKDKGSKEMDKKALASFAANFLIKNSNPSGRKEAPRVVSVTNERDINRSIFHLSWKTLFKGVKQSMGVKK